jgi:hypothetical protein
MTCLMYSIKLLVMHLSICVWCIHSSSPTWLTILLLSLLLLLIVQMKRLVQHASRLGGLSPPPSTQLARSSLSFQFTSSRGLALQFIAAGVLSPFIASKYN